MDINKLKTIIDERFRSRSLEKPMIGALCNYVRMSNTEEEVLEVMMRVIEEQDGAIAQIMENLVAAESRAFPGSMSVPEGNIIIGGEE